MISPENLVIKYYEKILEKIKRRLEANKKFKLVKDDFNKLEEKFKKIKFSYLEYKDLLEDINQFLVLVKEIESRLKDFIAKDSFLSFYLEELKDFGNRIKRNIKEPYQVFRYSIVEVLEIRKISDKLKLLKVKDIKSNKIFDVVTNLENVKKGDKRVIVFLEPREFYGFESKAMIALEYPINDIKDIKEEDLKKLNYLFFDFLNS